MKSCPTCSRTYPDNTLAFCLVDGSILSAPYDSETTQAFPATLVADTIPSLASQPIIAPETEQVHRSEKRSRTRGLLVGVVVCLLLIAGIIVGANWNKWFSDNSSLAKQANAENPNNNSIVKTTPSPTPSITPEKTVSPKITPPLTEKIVITGTWTGTFASRDAILYINSQDGDTFSGILKNSKGAIVAISGSIDADTRQISIQENRVVQGVSEGPDWILGSNTGSLSADGNRMSGRGKDSVGHAYLWAFHKQ